MVRFLPASRRANFVANFERLKQTPGMAITEYDIEFTRLSCYAPQLVATEALRAKRFIQGLANPLFTTLATQISKVTNIETMDAALLIEYGKMERRASKEAAKKPMTLGSFSDGSSSRGGMALRVKSGFIREGPQHQGPT